jgi:hypothetical protein
VSAVEGAGAFRCDDVITVRLLGLNLLDKPSKTASLPNAQRAPLCAEPLQMDLGIPTVAGEAGRLLQSPQRLFRCTVIDPWPQTTQPAPQAPNGNPEVVQCVSVAGVVEALSRFRRVVEQTKGDDARRPFSGFVKEL